MTTTAAISLAICTHSRSGQLRVTLESIKACCRELSPFDEILLIDNNSSDDTKAVCLQFVGDMKALKLSAKYFFESNVGLSAARNRALREFNTDFILFIDDDITLSAASILAYREALKSHSDASVFGGKILVDWGEQAPRWYRSGVLPMIDGLVGNYDLGSQDRVYLESDPLPFGANFGLRASVVARVGFFDTDLGVKGSEIGRGEESDYISRAFSMGFTGLYVSGALVKHRFQTERMNLRHLYRYGMQKGVAVSVDIASKPKWRRAMLGQLLKGGFQLCKGRVGHFYQCVINVGLYRAIGLKLAKQRREQREPS